MTLKVYCDRRYLPQGCEHVEMMYPYWGRPPGSGTLLEPHIFVRYSECGRQLFTLSSLHDADIAVFPAEWPGVGLDGEWLSQARRLAAAAGEAQKAFVVFARGDLHWKASIFENAWVFGRSLHRSERAPRQFAIPVWVDDYLARYEGGRLPLRTWTPVPTVGFCGYAKPWYLKHRVRDAAETLLGRVGIGPFDSERAPSCAHLFEGWRMRAATLRRLAKRKAVKTNFIVRRDYWNGVFEPDGVPDEDKWAASRREFLDNMFKSDYVLCIRGTENYSDRLYETLCCGRIPVVVDTDCVLPFHEDPEWRRMCVWIRADELDAVADRLLAFHQSLSPAQFAELQRACRTYWEQRLSPHGFFSCFETFFARSRR